jgi:PhnB protein
MPTTLNPYLNFAGNAREAMEFYKGVFGGELHVSTFKEYQLSQEPADDDKIMHSMLITGGGITLMGADVPKSMGTPGPNGNISLSGDNEAELRGYWDKLSRGSKITVPLEKAPWGDTFGMLTDQFGVEWLVNINGQQG